MHIFSIKMLFWEMTASLTRKFVFR